MEETEETEVSVVVPSSVPADNVKASGSSGSSILDQLAENVPWADDDNWQNQSTREEEEEEEEEENDETDEAGRADPSAETFVDQDGVHYLPDGHYWMETPGLPPADDHPLPIIPQIVTNDEPEPTRRNIRVRFSTGPIRGKKNRFENIPRFGARPVMIFIFYHIGSSLQHVLRQRLRPAE